MVANYGLRTLKMRAPAHQSQGHWQEGRQQPDPGAPAQRGGHGRGGGLPTPLSHTLRRCRRGCSSCQTLPLGMGCSWSQSCGGKGSPQVAGMTRPEDKQPGAREILKRHLIAEPRCWRLGVSVPRAERACSGFLSNSPRPSPSASGFSRAFAA